MLWRNALWAAALPSLILWLQAVTIAQDHYALEFLRPLPVGAAGIGLDPDNRLFRAYAGLTYTFRAEVIGGDFPYTFSLSGAPAGMTVDQGPCHAPGLNCNAGTVTWVNPTSTDNSITIEACDRDGDCVSRTWGVTVATTACGPGGF